jgi:acyl-ACP thioesterase
MASVCNWLQEAASLNAETLAFSKSNFEAAGENISWVLTRLKVRMTRFPRWGETVSILTFPRGGRRIVAYRDFLLSGTAGEELGRATSEWMLIDLASRKVVAIPDSVFAAANTVREPVFGEESFAKLRWDCREMAGDALSFRARRGDIDLNGHVNNVHYVEWLMEGRPDAAGPCHELDIVFKSETLAGEEVRVETVETVPGSFVHRVYAPDGRDHVIARTAC